MTIEGVTFHHEFGVSLNESGFNKVSAGLRVTRPELFAYSTDIVVKRADPGPPPTLAHILTLYAMVNEPLAFNLYPVAGAPEVPIDSLLVSGDISFSMTDSVLGTVTRVGAKIQAIANIAFENSILKLKLLDFKLHDFRGEQPLFDLLTAGPGTGLGGGSGPPVDPNLAATFRAIVDYLTELFLKEGLEKSVTEFPVPSLDTLMNVPRLGKLPVGGLYIRNNSFYAMIGNDLLVPTTFPAAPAVPMDLRLGVSKSGLHRVVKAFLPIPISFETGDPGTVFHITTSGLQIPRIEFSLTPGQDKFPAAVFLQGLINIRVKLPIPIFGGDLVFDLPLPLDPFTHYAGKLTPFAKVENPSNPGAEVQLRIAPDLGMFDDWYALIVPDYRHYLSNAFRDAVDRARDRLVGDKFCDIPVLGWIVCGVIDVTADVLGYLLGYLLDWLVGEFLTALIRFIGGPLLDLFVHPDFKIFSIEQAKLQHMMGVTVRSAAVKIVENGRDADLQVNAYFEDQGLPVPPVPPPLPPVPVPQPPAMPGIPGTPPLPIYDAPAFLPAITMPAPSWTNGARQRFKFSTQSPHHGSVDGTADLTFDTVGTGWRLRQTAFNAAGTKVAEMVADYGSQFEPRRSEHAGIGPTTTIRQIVDYTVAADHAVASLGPDGGPSLQRDEILRVGIPVEFEDFWLFRFAHAPLAAGPTTKFGRIAIVDPYSAMNWVREIPVEVSIQSGTYNWAPSGAAPTSIDVWVINASDELRRCTAHVAKDGSGLLHARLEGDEGSTEIVRA